MPRGETSDRRMFAGLQRGEPLPLVAKLVAALTRHPTGATPGAFADALVRAGLAHGPREPIVRRVAQLLGELEDAGHVHRTPDGRYRAPAR